MAKKEPDLSFIEAVDNLCSMAELDVLDEEDGTAILRRTRWIDPDSDAKTAQKVRESIKVVHFHLLEVSKDKKRLSDERVQRGIRSMMKLADEAMEKIDLCTDLFRGTHGGSKGLKEFRDLQEFYNHKIASRFKKILDDEEEWIEEYIEGEISTLDVKKQALRDMGSVKRDRNYELFSLVDEDGKPYYNRNLLRHLKLASDYDVLLDHDTRGDPLIKLPIFLDRQLHELSLAFKKEAKMHLSEFLKRAPAHKSEELVSMLYNAVSALFLASLHTNLIQKTSGKCVKEYFQDFQGCLRGAINTAGYIRCTDTSVSMLDPFEKCSLRLANLLCFLFFNCESFYEETLGLIDYLSDPINKAEAISFWNSLLEMGEVMSARLRSHPNGPLFKTLDTFISKDAATGFDPLAQDNFPSKLFEMHLTNHVAHFFRTPSPTKQLAINKATLAPEFIGLMNHIKTHKNLQPLLIVNFQDRTSWQEKSRATLIESLTDKHIHIVTIPKDTPFYFQADEYLKLDDATAFKKQLLEQVKGVEASGYFFPPELDTKEIFAFTKAVIETIHTQFFEKKPKLTRKERLDFIEIYYQFLLLKILDMLHPHYVTLMCKDGIDTSMAANATLFAFARIFSEKDDLSDEEKGFFKWMLYGPAIMIRERPIDMRRISRFVSMIAHSSLQMKEAKAKKAFAKHYSTSFLSKLHPKSI